MEFLKLSGVSHKAYFGGTLEGNQCSKLLDNYGLLENLAREHNRYDIACFVRVFKAFQALKKACFSDDLDPDFELIIDEFKESLIALEEVFELSITIKFHILCIHVKEYCKITGKSMKYITEQAVESSHRAWKLFVQRYWVDPETNPMFLFQILRALEVWNAEAI